MKNEDMLDFIIELQSLAQAGLYYGHDEFDKERYQRIRDISASMLSLYSGLPFGNVLDIFCHEVGYQTPKLDTRGVVFNERGEILLVQENDGLWSLPGGWVDINMSVKENVEKEVLEEAGLKVNADKIIAVMDRDKHNLPRYIYKVIKIFILCNKETGEFIANNETIASAYFSYENLPKLSTAKNNQEQIALCFKAYQDKNWQTYFD